MNQIGRRRTWMLCGALSLSAMFASAKVTPANVFGTNMILQRDRPVPVWGSGDPGEKVTVSFGGQTVSGVTDAAGKWRVTLAPMPASSEGRTLTIASQTSQTVTFRNILVGEVWLCSGQSNMQLVLWGAKPYVGKVGWREKNGYFDQLLTDEPNIRYGQIPNVQSDREQELRNPVCWLPFEAGKMKNFSAIAFHYALTLHRTLKVPVGVVVAAWGGTKIEPWISPDGFRSVPGLEKYATTPILPKSAENKEPQQQPRAIWNAMISPIAPFALRGVLWYQGGSNYMDGYAYKEYLHALYNGWTRAFEQKPDWPFYLVQITPYQGRHPPTACGLWKAEADFAKEIPNGGMVVTLDVAEPLTNCHPDDKRTISVRLAALALNKTYGRTDVPCQSPELKTAKMEGGKVRLTFDYVDQWIINSMEKIKFELAGADGVFHLADTELKQGGVALLSCKEVSAPLHVRYNWNWRWCGYLKNEYGLLLGPFDSTPIDQN